MFKKEVGPSPRRAKHSESVYLADIGAHGAKHTATIGCGASQKRTGWDGSLKETFPPFLFSKTIAGTLMLNRLVDSQPFVRSGRAAKRSLPLPPLHFFLYAMAARTCTCLMCNRLSGHWDGPLPGRGESDVSWTSMRYLSRSSSLGTSTQPAESAKCNHG